MGVSVGSSVGLSVGDSDVGVGSLSLGELEGRGVLGELESESELVSSKESS